MFRARCTAARLFISCLLLTPLLASGQVDEPAESVREGVQVHEHLVSVRIDGDRRLETRERFSGEVLDPSGREGLSQVLLFFAADLGEARLERLELRKPGGEVRDLLPDALQDVVPAFPPTLPIYSDLRVLRTAVPAVEVGDVVTFESVTTAQPITRRDLWYEFEFSAPEGVDEERFTLELDERSELAVVIDESVIELVDERREGGRWVRSWARRPAAVESKAEGSPVERADIQISSFSSWSDVGSWWSELSPVRSTRELRRKADELTADLESPRARLDALHRFVAQEIRYLSLPLGIGRYKPRDPGEVLRTGFGDCKDKHLLLASLAAAVDLRVDPVVINASGRVLDESVASPLHFDHVVSVAEIGGESVWMDSTSEMTPSGTLPAHLRDVRALRVGPGGAASLLTTPTEPPFVTSVSSETTGEIDAAGTIQARIRWTFSGDDEILRYAFKYGTREQRRAGVAPLHHQWKASKTEVGEITAGDPSDLSKPFWIEIEVRWKMSETIWQEPWDYWVPVPRFWFEKPPDEGAESDLPEIKFSTPRHQIARAKFLLPEGVIATPPIPVEINREFARYESRYEVEGRSIVLERSLERRSALVTDDSFSALRAFHDLMEADRDQEFDLVASGPGFQSVELSPKSLRKKGYDAVAGGRVDEGVALLEKAAELDPTVAKLWRDLGWAYERSGRDDEAEAAYRRAIEQDATDDYSYGGLAMLLWSRDELEEVERLLRKQIDVAPLKPFAMKKLGRRLLQKEELDEAEQWLRRANRIDSEDEETIELLFDVLSSKGTFDELAEIANEHPGLPSDLARRAWIAIGLVQRGTTDWSRFGPWIRRLVSEAETALGGYEGGRPSEEQVRAVAVLGVGWSLLGQVALQGGQDDEAEKVLRGAFRLLPIPVNAVALSEALRRRGATEMADLYLATATVLDPTGRERFGDLFVTTVPDTQYRRLLERRANEATWELRSVVAEAPEAAGASGAIWLVHGATGALEDVVSASESQLGKLAEELRSRGLVLELPPRNRVRIPLRGQAHCSPTGQCTIVFEPPFQTWRDYRQ